MQAGHPFFPAYFGEAGIVATPNDMYKWLLFNMGITRNQQLTPLLPVLQTPLTTTLDDHGEHLGLGWFIDPKGPDWPATIRKDGELDDFQSFIEFLPSLDPLKIPSRAGVFVLVNASRIDAEQQFGKDVTLAARLANDPRHHLGGLGQQQKLQELECPNSWSRALRSAIGERG